MDTYTQAHRIMVRQMIEEAKEIADIVIALQPLPAKAQALAYSSGYLYYPNRIQTVKKYERYWVK